jgi:hypothetical protein
MTFVRKLVTSSNFRKILGVSAEANGVADGIGLGIPILIDRAGSVAQPRGSGGFVSR